MAAPLPFSRPDIPRERGDAGRFAQTLGQDEGALVARIRAGDATAFEVVVRAYYGRLASYVATSTRSPEDAEEVVQSIFSTLWERRARWELRGSLTAYLYTAARNRSQRVRQRGRLARWWAAAAVRDELPSGMGMPAPTGLDLVEHAELAAAIARAVDRLPDRCRQAYILRQYHELSYADIARIMGTSVKTVDVQLWKAFKALKDALAPWADGR